MTKQVILWSCLLLFALSAKSQATISKVRALMESEQYSKAKELFKQLESHTPGDNEVWQLGGDLAFAEKAYPKAMEYYKKLVTKSPKNATYHYQYGGTMGLYARGLSKFKALTYIDDIKKHLGLTAQLDPLHIGSRVALSQLYCELPGILGGSYSKAMAYAEEVVAIDEGQGYLAKAAVYLHKEELKEAERNYLKAAEKSPSVSTYQALVSFYEEKQKNPTKALESAQQGRAQTKDPFFTKAIQRLSK